MNNLITKLKLTLQMSFSLTVLHRIKLGNIFLLLTILITSCNQEKTPKSFTKVLNEFGNVKIIDTIQDSLFQKTYTVMLQQPLDHENPDAGSFQQRVTFSHKGFDRPTVIVTEGYAMYTNYLKELCETIGANQIRIEHRYFGKSIPDTIDWKYLNTKQATADYHRIREYFGKYYTGKWLSTGWSKGGQTSLIYKRNYPEDIDVVVAYDAPVNKELEEKRVDAFFEKVGTEEIRKKLINFQRLVLSNKETYLPMFIDTTSAWNYKYSIGYEKALEYVVLEYPFSFWQYKFIPIEEIPDENSSEEEVFNHLNDVVSFGSYNDASMNSPSMYMFTCELGYYGYVQKNVRDLLSDSLYTNYAFAPQNTDLTFNPELTKDLDNWLATKGNNIIYLYGELDPWSAPTVNLTDKVNSKKFYLKGGNHFTFIKTFPDNQKQEIINQINSWLEE